MEIKRIIAEAKSPKKTISQHREEHSDDLRKLLKFKRSNTMFNTGRHGFYVDGTDTDHAQKFRDHGYTMLDATTWHKPMPEHNLHKVVVTRDASYRTLEAGGGRDVHRLEIEPDVLTHDKFHHQYADKADEAPDDLQQLMLNHDPYDKNRKFTHHQTFHAIGTVADGFHPANTTHGEIHKSLTDLGWEPAGDSNHVTVSGWSTHGKRYTKPGTDSQMIVHHYYSSAPLSDASPVHSVYQTHPNDPDAVPEKDVNRVATLRNDHSSLVGTLGLLQKAKQILPDGNSLHDAHASLIAKTTSHLDDIEAEHAQLTSKWNTKRMRQMSNSGSSYLGDIARKLSRKKEG